jgi:hypothetical protein
MDMQQCTLESLRYGRLESLRYAVQIPAQKAVPTTLTG